MRFLNLLHGNGLRSRALRGTAISLGGTGGQQMLRLASNLILTRLLFPEAFGLMALIQTFMTGLQMFSDIGLRPSVIQNRRGEDPDFLNTAWTIQIGRGVVLWLGACALAWPLAGFYNEPQILWLLPVVGINALITGFTSTKTAVASRNIQLGRQTVLALIAQFVGLVVMITLAIIWPSVWSLVVGSLVSSLIGVATSHLYMPGTPNRLRWDPSAARDLMNFGRFIFLSTLAGFFINQGDKLVLGRLVSFADLGIYNIGFFMATFPAMLGSMVAERVLFPLYRQIRPSESSENHRKIRRARSFLAIGMIMMFGMLALAGDPLIGLLYDIRYAPAGPMLVILSLMQIPIALTIGYSQFLLAEGNSRDFSRLVLISAVLNFAFLLAGFWQFGLFGVLMVRGAVILALYPIQNVYLRRHGGGDVTRDATFAALGLIFAIIAIWLHWPAISDLFITSRAAAPAVTGSWNPATIFGQ